VPPIVTAAATRTRSCPPGEVWGENGEPGFLPSEGSGPVNRLPAARRDLRIDLTTESRERKRGNRC